MSYTVFALKWRPQNFEEIIGQPHIVSNLKNAIGRDKLAHALLFAGPRGVGKTSTARILAKALNCKDGPTIDPCSKCPSCLAITQGRSLDVIEIDGASNRGIDEIRTLRESIKFAPVGGKFKIYIIDEVHQITTDGFNALLKTLEEPPPFVKFIFATTHPQKVIPTILSRCQRFDFRRIPAMEIAAQLKKIAAEEKIKIEEDVLFAIARSSDGALRDAESLLDQLASFSKEKISLQDINSVLGAVEQEALFEITEDIIRKDPQAALAVLNKIIDAGKDAELFLADLIGHFRNLMVVKVAGADSRMVDLPQEACEKLLQQSAGLSLEEIFSAFNALVNTREISKRLDSSRIPLEVALIKLAYSPDKPAHNPQPAPKEDKHKGNATKPQVKIEEEAPKDEKATDSPSLDNIKNAWHNIVEAIGRVKMYLAGYLNEGDPVKVERNILTISFPKDCSLHKESLEQKANRDIIEKILADSLQTDLRVNFVLSKEAAQPKDNADSNPMIKSALDAFGGRIIRET